MKIRLPSSLAWPKPAEHCSFRRVRSLRFGIGRFTTAGEVVGSSSVSEPMRVACKRIKRSSNGDVAVGQEYTPKMEPW